MPTSFLERPATCHGRLEPPSPRELKHRKRFVGYLVRLRSAARRSNRSANCISERFSRTHSATIFAQVVDFVVFFLVVCKNPVFSALRVTLVGQLDP